MGCNYYCHILPSKEDRKNLYDATEANDFSKIKRLVEEMYNPIRFDYETKKIIGGEVHLGKASGGWKFLWDPNVFVVRNGHMEDVNGTRRYVPDPDTAVYMYPLNKKGLKDFIDRKDVLIYDEYDEIQDKEEFWDMALHWGYDKTNNGWDAAAYEKYDAEHNSRYNRYPVTGELTDLLRNEGYKFTSATNSDFYSDGLRFAGFTDFS